MNPVSILTVCGIDELPAQGTRAVSHVLSILDPEWPELEAFGAYGDHHRTTLRFHDIIAPAPGRLMPTRQHVQAVLDFGTALSGTGRDGHLLVHCHMGVSRSTAAMLTLMAQSTPDAEDEALFERLRAIRPQAWPNSVMVGFADEMLGRDGRMVSALRRHYGLQIRSQPKYIEWMTSLDRTRELDMAA